MNFQDATMQGSKYIGGIRKCDIQMDKQAKTVKPKALSLINFVLVKIKEFLMLKIVISLLLHKLKYVLAT